MFFNSRHSDARRERALHLGIPLALAGGMLLGAVYAGNAYLSYALIVLSVGLNWAVIPIFWAVTTEHVSGVAAAVSIALINALANVAGLALPPVIGWIKDSTGSYDVALTLVASALIIGGLLGMALGRHRTSPVAQFSGQ
jgi:fucose permease